MKDEHGPANGGSAKLTLSFQSSKGSKTFELSKEASVGEVVDEVVRSFGFAAEDRFELETTEAPKKLLQPERVLGSYDLKQGATLLLKAKAGHAETVTLTIESTKGTRTFQFATHSKASEVIDEVVRDFAFAPEDCFALEVSANPKEELHRERTLASYHLKNGDKLTLVEIGREVRELLLTIQTTKGTKEFEFPKTTQVADAIVEVVKTFAFAAGDRFELVFARNPEDILQPDRTLGSYHLKNDERLILTAIGGGV